MDSSSQDKNLPATPQRLKKARDDGQVARSKDLSNVTVLGGGMLVLFALAPTGFAQLRDALASQLRFDSASVRTPELMLQRLSDHTAQALIVYLPLGLLVLALAVAALVAAGSFAFSTKPIEPKLSNISPLSGFKRLFSRQQVIETFKLVGITAVVLLVAGQFIVNHAEAFATLLMRPLEAGIGQLAQWLAVGVGLLLLVIGVVAAIDVPTQRFLHKHRLKMSHDEIKREHKEAEGDPHVKSQRRARQRQLAQRQSIRAVPKADLVVMNPTHYAVALRYDEATMAAPRVIAKGTDLLAMKIRDVAKANAVPVLQSPMLARALYAHAEIDQEIPGALYTAVAQVLAWVYQFKAAMNGQGRMPADPQPTVPPELDPHFKKKPQEAEE
ncbi:MAG: flagellar type III secretion system protein FlhB [Hydrogenophaga sp.]|uniref:EscU/YscU/HrcU family type III secretion system export apparatus switch protein n=1 Tax=Hydrogenophaga sp. TaxID=1904254 RepID=UPI0016B84B56|nr:flagellar type III secretion system protein FlhB [Hydrogenophaga sp.]NIM41640.1 flagellar type III secretion system protein FlhB [Hydrogenophaga sp.]NIN26945.1 flagellar type III secretion system protein FlhB [Hydrogenophaga sp.]NIN31646.1 flagellar type III secretion system protein FlhB [Hydrogenophaga sp.]NIN55890.1 flagellar type III secretion system protein FlhB [Hydrogenophaga sp.]NIO52017.1 flagellar type III secretion system protein FlhB [Hydrogenophaga sp.]